MSFMIKDGKIEPTLPPKAEDPFDSLRSALAFSPRDWSDSKDLAWVWGIIMGWDGDPADETDAMSEVAESFGWTKEQVECLRNLHAKFQQVATQMASARESLDKVERFVQSAIDEAEYSNRGISKAYVLDIQGAVKELRSQL